MTANNPAQKTEQKSENNTEKNKDQTKDQNKKKKKAKTASIDELSKVTSREEAKKKVMQTGDLFELTKFYAIPILSVLVFFCIILFAIIPSIKGIFRTLDEIELLQIEDEKLAEKIVKLEELEKKSARNAKIINVINELVPTESSEVVRFRQKVLDVAVKNGLSPDESRAGEKRLTTDITSDTEEEGVVEQLENLSLIEIPSNFEMNGQLELFINLLTELYSGVDFFIVNEMELDPAPTKENAENWGGDFDLIKYQFYTSEDFDPVSEYGSISIEQYPNTSVIKFLEDRYVLDLEEEETSPE